MLEKYGKVLLVLCMGAVIALLGLLVHCPYSGAPGD